MKILDDLSLCCGCHGCYNICPVQAIEMQRDEEGFKYPYIDQKKCIHCSLCKSVCPILKKRHQSIQKVYACYSKNMSQRMKSASGGVFYLLAKYIIKNNGVVFGAAFDSQFNVEHKCAENIEEVKQMRGSKYVQSCIGEQYSNVKKYLLQGRIVLFSGTPCQIGGLKSFLKKDYVNLICIDVVCHGVPSPEVWKKYLIEIKKGKKIKNIQFRNKEKGIKNAPLCFQFEEGSALKETYLKNYFIKGFINDLYLRPSCHTCQFKDGQRASDITIGDFWGIEKFRPEFGDKFGISLVMINTSKGSEIFTQIQNNINCIECTKDEAVEENPCIIKSVKKNKLRAQFFQYYKKYGVIRSIKKITRIPFTKKVKIQCKRLKYEVKYCIYLLWKKVLK